MKIVVITNDELKEELLAQGLPAAELIWQSYPSPVEDAMAYIDLLYEPFPERMNVLMGVLPATVIVNAVSLSPGKIPAGFIRINGWKTLLKRAVVEASHFEGNIEAAEKIFGAFHKTTEWVPDVAGFVSARVISMIINEAWLSLDEKVSTKEEIDTAMKLGTNYPYGPFEWGEKIGLKNVVALLDQMALNNERYKPCELLRKHALR